MRCVSFYVYFTLWNALRLSPCPHPCVGRTQFARAALCAGYAQPVTIWLRFACQIYLVSNLLQRSLQMIQPSDPEPKIKTPIRVFEFLGWGNWIRTNTSGVRVRCSTIKLCPKVPWIIYPRFSFCNTFQYTILFFPNIG